jgi:hypothetical protein
MCVKNMHYGGGGGYVDQARAYEWEKKKKKPKA